MISLTDHTLDESIALALRKCGGKKVSRVRAGQWVVENRGGLKRRITVSLCDDLWLQFTSDVAQGRIHGEALPRCAWDLVKINATLDGSAKIALAPGRSGVTLIRELRLDQEESADETIDSSLAIPVREALHDIDEASDKIRGDGNPAAPVDQFVPDQIDLCELSQLAGWPCNRRAEGRVAVQLDIPGSYAQAILRPGPRIHAVVDLTSSESLSPRSRQAIGMLLLQVAGHVRWVRGAVHAGAAGETPVLEGKTGSRPSTAELNQLLAALSVAARMTFRELPALASEDVAEKYLSIRGCSPQSV